MVETSPENGDVEALEESTDEVRKSKEGLLSSTEAQRVYDSLSSLKTKCLGWNLHSFMLHSWLEG